MTSAQRLTAERILDREARRLLAEKLEATAKSALSAPQRAPLTPSTPLGSGVGAARPAQPLKQGLEPIAS